MQLDNAILDRDNSWHALERAERRKKVRLLGARIQTKSDCLGFDKFCNIGEDGLPLFARRRLVLDEAQNNFGLLHRQSNAALQVSLIKHYAYFSCVLLVDDVLATKAMAEDRMACNVGVSKHGPPETAFIHFWSKLALHL